LIQAGFQVLAGSGQTMSGSVAADALSVAYPFTFQAALKTGVDKSLLELYEQKKYQKFEKASWTDPWSFRLHDSSIHRPENVAAVVGQALGSVATRHSALSALLIYRGSPFVHEAIDRARIGATMALAYSGPTPWLPAALAYFGTPQSSFTPLAEVKDQLMEELQEGLARKLIQADLADLESKLRDDRAQNPDKLLMSQAVNRPEVIASTLGQAFGSTGTGAPLALTAPLTLGPPAISHYAQARAREALVTTLAGPNPYPFLTSGLAPLLKVRKAIDQAVKSYGFEHGSTRKPDDRDTIADDPGLKPFKEAYLHDPQNRDPQVKNFASQLFQNPVAYSPRPWPLGRNEMDQGPSFLYWKTNDKPAYVPTFAEVQDKVKDWWQLDKARELAKKEAEDLMAKAKGQPDAQRWLKDGTKHSEPMFMLDDVARLVKVRSPNITRESFNAYQPYQVPKEKIEYPPEGLQKDLFELNEPGQVIVRSDRPKAIYYVFALVKRTVPSEYAFYREYASGPESLLGSMDRETDYQGEYRRALLDQLREQARLNIINRDLVEEKGRSDES
jgi:hypothetical protein